MSDRKDARPPLPRWVWPFAAACFAIPVVALGGAIPSGLGVFGAFYCLAAARDKRKSVRNRLIHCFAATSTVWALFFLLVVGVTAVIGKPSDPAARAAFAESEHQRRMHEKAEAKLADEESRREIYAMAVRMRKHMSRIEDRRADRLRRGLDASVSDRQLEHITKMHEGQLDFTAHFHGITREKLDELVAEGDRKSWPLG